MGPSLGLGSMKLVTIEPLTSNLTIEPWHHECFCTVLNWIASTLAGILVTPTWHCSSECTSDTLARHDIERSDTMPHARRKRAYLGCYHVLG